MDESGEGQGNLINFLPKHEVVKTVTLFSCSEELKQLPLYYCLLWSGRESLGYSDDEDVYAVLEEDGTEVDEEEYFMMLEHRYDLFVSWLK